MANSKLQDFCPFPKDIKKQEFDPFHIPASNLMQNETGLITDDYAELRDAFITASPYAHWRQAYKGTTIGEKFLNEFGCYGLIGPESPFQSEKIRAWVVYMPKNFYYPWHQHPAEEMYLCLAGEAVFRRENYLPTSIPFHFPFHFLLIPLLITFNFPFIFFLISFHFL